ncbi:DgyrCDS12919 [Dimorphilus gyrociliatus]|uniref:DgyrCDS12919 n=1 Tax=Dimorphilus gyrociliatus TaxID=2664684 RepID=A0A7I8W943_9ANNE|nr:DgyrCDS12919 [Dimorphilus gyrociliatus]
MERLREKEVNARVGVLERKKKRRDRTTEQAILDIGGTVNEAYKKAREELGDVIAGNKPDFTNSNLCFGYDSCDKYFNMENSTCPKIQFTSKPTVNILGLDVFKIFNQTSKRIKDSSTFVDTINDYIQILMYILLGHLLITNFISLYKYKTDVGYNNRYMYADFKDYDEEMEAESGYSVRKKANEIGVYKIKIGFRSLVNSFGDITTIFLNVLFSITLSFLVIACFLGETCLHALTKSLFKNGKITIRAYGKGNITFTNFDAMPANLSNLYRQGIGKPFSEPNIFIFDSKYKVKCLDDIQIPSLSYYDDNQRHLSFNGKKIVVLLAIIFLLSLIKNWGPILSERIFRGFYPNIHRRRLEHLYEKLKIKKIVDDYMISTTLQYDKLRGKKETSNKSVQDVEGNDRK